MKRRTKKPKTKRPRKVRGRLTGLYPKGWVTGHRMNGPDFQREIGSRE